MGDTLREIVTSFSHLFYPHLCRGCGNDILSKHQLLCWYCLAKLPLTSFAKHPDNPVEKSFWGRINAEAAMSLLYFTPASLVQQLVHQIKYKGQQKLAISLGMMMGREILQSGRFGNIDQIIPLPLFRSREKKRGYNQSALLADGISEIINTPVNQKAISRVKVSATQTHKSREERWQNVEGLFRVNPDSFMEGKNILLVDDVITTGATIDACGTMINRVQGTTLYIATLAYALQ